MFSCKAIHHAISYSGDGFIQARSSTVARTWYTIAKREERKKEEKKKLNASKADTVKT